MKTINFELSKRLNDLWLLDNVETEYWIEYDNEYHNHYITYYLPFNKNIICKTLTLEEAIETLFAWTSIYFRWWRWNWTRWSIDIYSDSIISHLLEDEPEFEWETLLGAIEKMLEYLLDNNLLTK